jgi:D-3-phosphoglycerate dehydrogenase
MLAMARNVPQANASTKAGQWEKKKMMGRELRGKTLGVLGLGSIGREVVLRARAFEMRVIATGLREPTVPRIFIDLVALDRLLASDYTPSA